MTTLEETSLDLIQITNLRWRPKTSENILVSTTAGGCINFWNVDQSKIEISNEKLYNLTKRKHNSKNRRSG